MLINWNGAELTVPCLVSIRCGKIQPDRIVVVDNDSSDGSAAVIAERYPEIELIRNNENRGFAGGNNTGVERLVRDEIDYIWILNNDTEVDADCLGEMLSFMDRNPDVGGCCGKILYHGHENRIWFAGARFNPWMLSVVHRGASKTDVGKFERAEETPFITGCSMFIRSNVWKQTGFFDERFFAYSEDFDWCLRAIGKGFRFYYVPKALIYHKVSSSFLKKNEFVKGYSTPRMIELIYRNRIYLLRKHISNAVHFYLLVLIWIIKASAYSVGLVLLGRFNKSKAVWKGIKAGMDSY